MVDDNKYAVPNRLPLKKLMYQAIRIIYLCEELSNYFLRIHNRARKAGFLSPFEFKSSLQNKVWCMMHENVHHLSRIICICMYPVRVVRDTFLRLRNLCILVTCQSASLSSLTCGVGLCSRSPSALSTNMLLNENQLSYVHVTCTHLSAPLPSSYSCKIICIR